MKLSDLISKPQFMLGLIVLTFAVGFGLGIRWQRGADAIEQQQNLSRLANARRKQEEAQQKIAASLESQLAALDAQNRSLTRRLYAETNKPEYRCVLPSGGMQLRSAALTHSPGKPDSAMPAAH